MQSAKKKKLIIANSFLLLFLIAGSVFAWFAVNYNNHVSSNDVTVVADNALELSIDNTNWSSNINLSNEKWFSNVKFTDITGSGNGKFLRPTLEQQVNYASVDDLGTWKVPAVNLDYVKFTLYMRSKDPLTVSLGKDSRAATPDDSALLETSDNVPSNPSSFSTRPNCFSKDIVVGAVRVSACESGTNDNIFTWIPRPEIFVSDSTATGKVTYDAISTNASSTESSYKHKYYDYTSKELTTDSSVLTGTITDSNSKNLKVLVKNRDTGYYEGKVDFYVWLEGCDNEARRAFVGGNFKLYLNIVSEG